MHYTLATLPLVLALLLGGCGQMGPLYAPEASAPAAPTLTPPATPPANNTP